MLRDLGLPDKEYLERKKLLEESQKNLNYTRMGCISELLCENCGHRISDSICLCSHIFVCPNCNFQNGQRFIDEMERFRERKDYPNYVDISSMFIKKEYWNYDGL